LPEIESRQQRRAVVTIEAPDDFAVRMTDTGSDFQELRLRQSAADSGGAAIDIAPRTLVGVNYQHHFIIRPVPLSRLPTMRGLFSRGLISVAVFDRSDEVSPAAEIDLEFLSNGTPVRV